jgi:hypothetical protein
VSRLAIAANTDAVVFFGCVVSFGMSFGAPEHRAEAKLPNRLGEKIDE